MVYNWSVDKGFNSVKHKKRDHNRNNDDNLQAHIYVILKKKTKINVPPK